MTMALTEPIHDEDRDDWRSFGPIRLLLDPMTWRAVPYLFLSFLLGLVWFVMLVTLISLSVGLVVVWVGVPLFALTMVAWRGGAMLERLAVNAAFGVEIASPYRPTSEQGLMRKWRTMLGDPATWKDLAYLLLAFPVGLAEFIVSVTLWTTSIALIVAPLIVLLAQAGSVHFDLGGGSRYILTNPAFALVGTLVGLLFLTITLYAVRGMSIAHVAFARLLLGRGETAELAASATRLKESRARGVDSAETERRRIERDLHDGAQQRLLALAVDLGRARAKMDEDPAGARELVEHAHEEAKATLADLRDLARGIHPAVLTDRGLDAALSALAARSPVPLALNVDLPQRPPPAVESIAYFVVTEALSNATKHASATEVGVRILAVGDRVFVEVTDDGIGGAAATPGGGLAGLAERAATIDGTVVIDSPVGGPTVIRAELPCAW